jgi:transcriptional regulator with XRE-family HTH domain
MAVHGSPAVARHRLRLALRRRREAAGRTQGDIAKSLDWSLSKIQRIEAGENAISTTDLRALLGQLKVNDPDLISTLVAEAKVARGRSPWDEPRYRESLTPSTKALLEFEAAASRIRSFQTVIVPGMLQIPEVAEAMLTSNANLTEDERATRLEVRLARRRNVLDRPNPPDFRLILDESILYRDIGGPAIYRRQLGHLLTQANERRISLRIAPYSVVASLAVQIPFLVLTMDSEDDSILYRENYQQDEIIQAPDRVAVYIGIFEELWRRSFAEKETVRILEDRISQLA